MTTNKIIPIFKQDKGESPFPASFTPPDEDPLHSLGKSSTPYPRPAPLSDPSLSAKIASGYTLIDEYYSRLQNLAHINIRPQQIQLSKRVFEGFMRKIPSFNQAPTGTGKTLAYLVGAIAASQCSLVSKPQNNETDNETDNPKKTKKTSPPIVIATATVTLLDQIIHKDIPLLLKANIPLSASSIKGRQRYYCPNSANIIAEELRSLDPQLSLLNQDPSESHQHVDEFERQRHIQQFHHHFSNGWNGEQETYSGPTKYWPDVRAHQDTCLQSACDFYDQCPFYKARKQMNIVDILITTHDFVLQDLSMKKTDSSQSLLRDEYLLVIDEAHQFPLKAHKLGSSAITPLALIEKLHAMRAVTELILQYPKLRVLLEKQEIRFNDFEISNIQRNLSELHSILNDIYSECHKQVPHTLKKELDRPQLKRLRNDMIIALNSKLKTLKNTAKLCARITAPDLLQPAQKLAALITPLLTIVQDISTQINLTHQNPQKPSITTELLSNPLSPYASKPNSSSSFEHAINAFDSTVTTSIYPKLRQYILGAPPEASISQTRYSELLTALSNASPLPISQRLIKHMLDKLIDEHKNFCAVSWLDASTCPEGVDPASFQPQLSLYGESLAGTQRLRELLWDQSAITPAFLSATLGNINAFKASTGLPQDRESFTKNLRHIFDYSQHEMHIVDTLYTPKFDQRANFLKELFREIPLCVNPLEATLILCPNRKILATVQRALQSCTSIDPSSILVQGSAGLQSLIDTHKQRIDRGLGSILCGVESLCEGLDLQGNYCTHVIITAIPFSSTTSPVEQEWQQILQDDYFSQRLLPQTLIKLVQMIGRLIRRESDYGKITIFDRRLLDRWAQKDIHPLLPPFNRSTIQPPSTLSHKPPAPPLTNQPPQYPHHTTPVPPPSPTPPSGPSTPPTPPRTPSSPDDCGSPLKQPPILLHDPTRANANHPPDRQPTAQSPLSSKDRLSPSSSSKDAHHAA